jgi:hypothetical protein
MWVSVIISEIFFYQNGEKTGTVASSVAMISVYCRPILKPNKCVAYQILHLQIQTGNHSVWNDPRGDEIWILHTEFLHIVYIWVLDFFCLWHLENPGWLKGEILGSNGTITLHCLLLLHNCPRICMLQHLLFRRLSEMQTNSSVQIIHTKWQ